MRADGCLFRHLSSAGRVALFCSSLSLSSKVQRIEQNILREHFNWCLAILAAVSALLQFHGDLKVVIRKCSTDVRMHPSVRSYFTFHHFSVPVNKLAVNIMQKHLFFLFSMLLQINMCVLDVGLASRCSNYFRSVGRRWNCVKLLSNRESRGEEMCRPLARCEWLLFQLKRMTHVTAAAPECKFNTSNASQSLTRGKVKIQSSAIPSRNRMFLQHSLNNLMVFHTN